MITGQNSEVRHQSSSFHVQTEDKGISNPFIESLVYLGGQVLASKRTSYAQVLADGCSDEEIAALMDRQHRAMIASIQRGSYDAQIRELLGGAEAPQEETNGQSLDEAVFDYLDERQGRASLLLFEEQEVEPTLGMEKDLVFRTASSSDDAPVVGADVQVRVICALAPPQSLGGAETDRDGVARVHVRLPDSFPGPAALIVTAQSDLGQAEIKYLL
jgi:hypothetical protein